MQARRFKYCPDDITVPPGRMRALDAGKVATLADSIRKIGLQTPPHVREVDAGEGAVEAILVAGLHRLRALQSLGLGGTRVDVTVLEGTPDEVRMWEISENLHRAELTVLERAEHIAEWVRLSITGEPKAQVAPSQHTGGRPSQGINAAVRDLGIERTEAQRSIKIDRITPEAKEAARDAGLADNQAALLRVAAAPPTQQPAKVAEIAARKPEPRDPLATICAAWRALTPEQQDDFRIWILSA